MSTPTTTQSGVGEQPGRPAPAPASTPAATRPGSVTTSVVRHVQPGREHDFLRWTEAGMGLARTFPGFLGGGWVMSATDESKYFVQYRFTDQDALSQWLTSPLRKAWIRHGSDFATDAATHRRTGIEGWFDSPDRAHPPAAADTVDAGPPAPPRRWKQAATIWLGFFPVSLLVNYLLVPHLADAGVVVRTLVVTLICTPLMTYLVLPFLTARLAPWLRR